MRKCGIITLFSCGGFLLIVSLVLLIIWPTVLLTVLRNQLVLGPNSPSYEFWHEIPIPMYLEVFFYNLTNSQELIADPDNVKPNFEELGPYVFSEYHIKINETWHENGTVNFFQRRTWFYEPSKSNGSLSDKITNINPVIATAGNILRDFSKYIKIAANTYMKRFEKIVITKTAEELMFKGYQDNLVDIVNNLIPDSIFHIPYDKFGWFYDRNASDTYDGALSIFTGASDINKLGDMDLWNYNNRVDYYTGECGEVKGSTGELFPPQYMLDYISVFATDTCSVVKLKKFGFTDVHGIKGSLFVGDDSVFDNGFKYPEEKCFCNPRQCAPPGTRDVSKCKMDAPAFVSFPHFYLADPFYTSKITGLKPPNKDNDEFRVAMETFTGVPLLAKAQLQVSLYIERIDHLSIFNQLPDKIFFPMFWFRQEVEVTEDLANTAKLGLLVIDIVKYVLYALLVIGAVLISIGTYSFIKNSRTNLESQVLVDNEVIPDES